MSYNNAVARFAHSMNNELQDSGSSGIGQASAIAGSAWRIGLLALGLFFLYRGVRIVAALVHAGRFLPWPAVLCAVYFLCGTGIILRKNWARALTLAASPILALNALWIMRRVPPSAQGVPMQVLFVTTAAFVYLLIPRVGREFQRSGERAPRSLDFLAPPPRPVPLSLKLSVLFGNPFMLLSWLLPGAVFCAIAHEFRRAGAVLEPGMPWGLAVVWIALWLFFFGVMAGVTVKLAGWILSCDIRLLEHGLLGQAVLTSKTKIQLPGDGGPIYRLRFEYEVNGKKFHTWMDTPFTQRLLDEEREPILYDPQKPGSSTLLDELPAHVEFDDGGRLLHRHAFMGYLYLLIPIAVLAGMVYMTAL